MGCASSLRGEYTVDHQPAKYNEISIDVFIQLLNSENYEIKEMLAEGSMAKVYAARDKDTGQEVALKFFGYTTHASDFESVKHELELMSLANDIYGIVHTYGYFLDTEHGLVPGKRRRGCFPVVVMEKLAGGELFDWIRKRSQFTEQSVAQMFKMITSAVAGLHNRRLLHRKCPPPPSTIYCVMLHFPLLDRPVITHWHTILTGDIKLENIMLLDNSDTFTPRIVDFGLMVCVPPQVAEVARGASPESSSLYSPEHCYYRGWSIQGSPGLVAPESIMHFDYSCKSDVWQLGCLLYSLLSAAHPFSPTRVDRILAGVYYPMQGVLWDGVSEEAKKLVAWMLQKDPSKRPTTEEILLHPWLDHATEMGGGSGDLSDPEKYVTRLRGLVLTQKLRSVFLHRDWVSRDTERISRREHTTYLRVKWSNDSIPRFSLPARNEGGLVTMRAESIDEYDSTDDSDPLEEHSFLSVEERLQLLESHCNRLQQEAGAIPGSGCEVDFPLFVELLTQCSLQKLATTAVFKIFNYKKANVISLDEFLESMKAVFRSEDPKEKLLVGRTFTIEEDFDPEDEEALNIFRMLDVKNRGFVTMGEMKVGIRCIMMAEYLKSPRKCVSPGHTDAHNYLLQQQRSSRSTLTHSTVASAPTSVKSSDVESLFRRLDPLRSGKIDFEAFKAFYKDITTPNPSPAHFTLDYDNIILEESEGFGSVCE